MTIFFATARRNPISGCLTGCFIGCSTTYFAGPSHPLGMYGIALTIVGYLASSLGGKIDVENPGSRFLITFFFFGYSRGRVLLCGTRASAPGAAMELEPHGHLGAM